MGEKADRLVGRVERLGGRADCLGVERGHLEECREYGLESEEAGGETRLTGTRMERLVVRADKPGGKVDNHERRADRLGG